MSVKVQVSIGIETRPSTRVTTVGYGPASSALDVLQKAANLSRSPAYSAIGILLILYKKQKTTPRLFRVRPTGNKENCLVGAVITHLDKTTHSPLRNLHDEKFYDIFVKAKGGHYLDINVSLLMPDAVTIVRGGSAVTAGAALDEIAMQLAKPEGWNLKDYKPQTEELTGRNASGPTGKRDLPDERRNVGDQRSLLLYKTTTAIALVLLGCTWLWFTTRPRLTEQQNSPSSLPRTNSPETKSIVNTHPASEAINVDWQFDPDKKGRTYGLAYLHGLIHWAELNELKDDSQLKFWWALNNSVKPISIPTNNTVSTVVTVFLETPAGTNGPHLIKVQLVHFSDGPTGEDCLPLFYLTTGDLKGVIKLPREPGPLQAEISYGTPWHETTNVTQSSAPATTSTMTIHPGDTLVAISEFEYGLARTATGVRGGRKKFISWFIVPILEFAMIHPEKTIDSTFIVGSPAEDVEIQRRLEYGRAWPVTFTEPEEKLQRLAQDRLREAISTQLAPALRRIDSSLQDDPKLARVCAILFQDPAYAQAFSWLKDIGNAPTIHWDGSQHAVSSNQLFIAVEMPVGK